jgi:hypothetical protein
MSAGFYTSYYVQGLLRQPNAEKAKEYLKIGEGDDGSSAPVPPGSGDVVGPAGAVNGHIAQFSGATGKIIADSGIPSSQVPSPQEKAALSGTDGAPGAANEYVTDSDPRNTNSRTPTAHAASHQNGGADEINVAGLSGLLADQQTPLGHQATHQSGNADALTGLVDANARVAVNKNSGAVVGTRRRINFIEGPNVTLTVADDAGNEEVDVTVAASGGASDWDFEITKQADQSVTDNATPQNDSELLWNGILANSLYLVEAIILYTGNNITGDYRGRFTFPANPSTTGIGFLNGFGAGGLSAQITPLVAASTTAWPTGDLNLGVTGVTTDLLPAFVRFYFRTAGAGGTLQYQFSNFVAAAGRTSTTLIGSTLRVKRFA